MHPDRPECCHVRATRPGEFAVSRRYARDNGASREILVIAAGAAQATWFLIFVLVVASAIGLFYYLRIIAVIFSHERTAVSATRGLSILDRVVLVALACLAIGATRSVAVKSH